VDDFREERRARGAAGWQARPDLSTDKSGKKEGVRPMATETMVQQAQYEA
jgi:hypothetical protein